MKGRLDEDVYDASGAIIGRRKSGGSQQVGGAFVQGVLAPTEALRVEASARVDAWRSYDGSRVDNTVTPPTSTTYASKSNAAFAPRLGVRYRLADALTLRGSAYRAFRAPTLSEQYRTFFAGPNTFMGNPALTPEYLTGYDAGVDWQPLPALEVRATGFYNRYSDLANFTFLRPGDTEGSAVLQRQNVGKARSRGGEALVALRLPGALDVTAFYNSDDARVVVNDTTGAYINRVPLQRAAVRVGYAAPRVATAHLTWRYEGPNHTLSGVRLAPFAVVDADVRREVLPGTSVFVSVENLLDREYTVNYAGALEYLGLPRTVRGGVTVRSF
jgi:outer membrane receptor protein involved in Fe transport